MFVLKTCSPRPGSLASINRFADAVQQLIDASSDYAHFTIPQKHVADFVSAGQQKGVHLDTEKNDEEPGCVDVWLRPANTYSVGTGNTQQFANLLQDWMERAHPGEAMWTGTTAKWKKEASCDNEIGCSIFSMSSASVGRRLRETSKVFTSGVSLIRQDRVHGNTYQIENMKIMAVVHAAEEAADKVRQEAAMAAWLRDQEEDAALAASETLVESSEPLQTRSLD